MIADKVPPVEELEGRFHFIADDTLRRNIALAFQYTIFLIAVLDEAGAEGSSIASSTHKDMITHTACCVEACTHYVLAEYVRTGRTVSDDVMPREDKFQDQRELYRVSPNERLIFAREVKKIEKLSPKTQLKSLNEAALNAGIFDRDMFDKAEELRNMRNRIHLAGLESVDSSYEKAASNRAFELAKLIVEQIETKLNELRINPVVVIDQSVSVGQSTG